MQQPQSVQFEAFIRGFMEECCTCLPAREAIPIPTFLIEAAYPDMM
jgi:hypothetical protein